MKKILLVFSLLFVFGLTACTTGGTMGVAIQGIEIVNEAKTRTVYLEETLQLSAVIYPAEFDQRVKWTSSDDSVATVDDSGLVTAKKVGKVEIIATPLNHSRVSQKYALIIEEKPEVEILPTSIEITSLNGETTCKVGEKITLAAKVNPADASQKVEWASSDPSIASVVRGIVTPSKEGTVTITATAKGHSEVYSSIELTFEKSDDPVFTKDWPNMNFATHEEYQTVEDDTPLKIKGVVVHVNPVDGHEVSYFIQNGTEGYYVYAQNNLVFPVEVGKVYEVGGFKKYYRGTCEIVNVEYFKEIEEEITYYANELGDIDPTSVDAMNAYHASLIKGTATFVSATPADKAFNFYALVNGISATFRVDPAYIDAEEFDMICNILSAGIKGVEFEFTGFVLPFGYGKPAVQIQIVSQNSIKFADVAADVVLDAAMEKVQIAGLVSNLKDAISLPSFIEGFSDVTLSWESDSELINVETGKVTHASENVTVTLTLTLETKGVTLQKEFEVLVEALSNREYTEVVNFDVDDALDANSWGNSESKPGYASGTVTLGTPAHTWLLNNALIAATSSDKYEGKFSIRAQAKETAAQTGRIEIQEDGEYNCVEFLAAVYGGDEAGIKIRIEYSTDSGKTWVLTDAVTIESTTLETFRITLPDGVKRVAIVVVENSGRRVNIDEIKLLK